MGISVGIHEVALTSTASGNKITEQVSVPFKVYGCVILYFLGSLSRPLFNKDFI